MQEVKKQKQKKQQKTAKHTALASLQAVPKVTLDLHHY